LKKKRRALLGKGTIIFARAVQKSGKRKQWSGLNYEKGGESGIDNKENVLPGFMVGDSRVLLTTNGSTESQIGTLELWRNLM